MGSTAHLQQIWNMKCFFKRIDYLGEKARVIDLVLCLGAKGNVEEKFSI